VTKCIHFGGHGEPIVFIHGFGADSQTFAGNIANLESNFALYGIDLPGHGQAWASAPATSVEAMADDVRSVLEQESIGAAHLVGHSLGAALALLLTQSVSVKSLTLIAPMGLGEGVSEQFTAGFIQLSDKQSVLQHLQLLVNDPRMISPQIAPMVLAQLSRRGVKASLSQIGKFITHETNASLYNAINAASAQPDLKKLVFWGKQDRINPHKPADRERFNADWHELSSCGHLPHIEHRIRFDRTLRTMLDES